MEVFEFIDEHITDNGEIRRGDDFLTSFKVAKRFSINFFPFEDFLVDRGFVEL